ncbi:MAG: HAD family hydrolase [Gammaproteobacteria bacterium]|jgi:putative hydrolase of the HAD superfamily|nr:HAD family hydrolase [Gammaproteobacteria bacterium]
MVRVITFDLDNTLWDVEPALLRAEEAQAQWLREHRPRAMALLDDAALLAFKKDVWQRHPELAHNMTQMRKQTLFELQTAAGYSELDARNGAEQAFAVFLQQRHQVELYAEALDIVAELAQDYTLGALTNGNADIYKTAAGPYFEFAYLAEEVGASKPHPALFEAALQATGADPHRIVHVGDDPHHDIGGAKAMGLKTVWMNGRNKPWPGGARADYEVTNLRDLPAAIRALARDT